MNIKKYVSYLQYKKNCCYGFNWIVETDSYIVTPFVFISKNLVDDIEDINKIIEKNNKHIKDFGKSIPGYVNDESINNLIEKFEKQKVVDRTGTFRGEKIDFGIQYDDDVIIHRDGDNVIVFRCDRG